MKHGPLPKRLGTALVTFLSTAATQASQHTISVVTGQTSSQTGGSGNP